MALVCLLLVTATAVPLLITQEVVQIQVIKLLVVFQKAMIVIISTLITHDSGVSTSGSVQLNVTNLQFLHYRWVRQADLGNWDYHYKYYNCKCVHNSPRYIERIANARAENGAEQNRVLQTIDFFKLT